MTYNDSLTLAKNLKRLSPAILNIELFGSVARNGHGRDADFLILVNNELAKRWWIQERELIRVRWPDFLYKHRWIVKKFMLFAYTMKTNKPRRERLKASADMLDIQLRELADPAGRIPDFEMFLMPKTWRTDTKVNFEIMRRITDLTEHRNTVGFLKRIASEARRIV